MVICGMKKTKSRHRERRRGNTEVEYDEGTSRRKWSMAPKEDVNCGASEFLANYRRDEDVKKLKRLSIIPQPVRI